MCSLINWLAGLPITSELCVNYLLQTAVQTVTHTIVPFINKPARDSKAKGLTCQGSVGHLTAAVFIEKIVVSTSFTISRLYGRYTAFVLFCFYRVSAHGNLFFFIIFFFIVRMCLCIVGLVHKQRSQGQIKAGNTPVTFLKPSYRNSGKSFLEHLTLPSLNQQI